MKVFKNVKILMSVFLIIVISLYFCCWVKKVQRPNVLIITVDALRPDHLNCYGYKRDTSPNIDSLAKGGVIFKQVISQAAWTHPSNCSFFTSSYPYMHIIGGESYLNPAKISLAKVLNNAGYKTIFLTDYPTVIGAIKGFNNEFDSYITFNENELEKVTDFALDILTENRNKKFFLWVYYFGTHESYGGFSEYSRRFYNDNLVGKRDIEIQPDYASAPFGVIPKCVEDRGITDISYYIAKYDGQLKLIDDQIGLILKKLKELKIDRNTIVILLADHGESLGEHNLYFQHTNNLYDISLKVPLIVKYPKLIPQNKEIKSQVRLIDVMPTIIDVLKINPNSNSDMEGKSLLPLMLDDHLSTEPYAFSDLDNWIFSIRTENWKLIFIDRQLKKDSCWIKYYKNDYELYDLKADPYETRNLTSVGGDKFLFLKEKLDKYIEQARVYQIKLRKEINPGTEVWNEDRRKKLRSLGYLQ